MQTVRIATRQSPLALWQAEYIKSQLLALDASLLIELIPFVTQGDKILDSPLSKMGGKGLFVKELEIAMMQDEADIAVHSMKDVPMELPAGFMLAAICQREDPRDAFVSNHYQNLEQLPLGACVGTSSLRRKSQLLHLRPDLTIIDLRGNVGTRLAKLDAGQYDAIILASSGLIRLGLVQRISQFLPVELLLPAVGQGALGIECHKQSPVYALVAQLNDGDSHDCVLAERAMNKRLMGGCQVPIAGYAILQGEQLTLTGRVASIDGQTVLHQHITGSRQAAQQLGITLAEQLLAMGAGPLLEGLS